MFVTILRGDANVPGSDGILPHIRSLVQSRHAPMTFG